MILKDLLNNKEFGNGKEVLKSLKEKDFTSTFKFEVKEVVSNQQINGVDVVRVEGYGSTFGNVDRGGDMMMKGCFEECLRNLKYDSNRKIAFLVDHQMKSEKIAGIFEDVYEDDKGLYVKGAIPNIQANEKLITDLKLGAYQGFSIGFRIKEWSYDEENDILKIIKAELYEVSLVIIPMNGECKITEVKSLTDQLSDTKDIRELEKVLRKNTKLESTEVKAIISKMKEFSCSSRDEESNKPSRDEEAVEEKNLTSVEDCLAMLGKSAEVEEDEEIETLNQEQLKSMFNFNK